MLERKGRRTEQDDRIVVVQVDRERWETPRRSLVEVLPTFLILVGAVALVVLAPSEAMTALGSGLVAQLAINALQGPATKPAPKKKRRRR
jgi:hypothetical protein